MLWWLWLILGIVLIGFELLTPGGFYILFFGASALALGALGGLGLSGPIWLQWLLFSVLAVVSLVLLRAPLMRRIKLNEPGSHAVDSLVDEIATPAEEIAPGAIGRVELRGSSWSARNAGQVSLARGQRCRVIQVDGLLLSIRAE